jgi:hypothetical protein
MKKAAFVLLIIASLLKPGSLTAQLVVENNLTVEQLVQQIFVGQGITVVNIQFNGNPANQVIQAGYFNSENASMPIKSGMLLATGPISVAIGPNTSGGAGAATASNYFDLDLNTIATLPTYDAAVLEFDFVPSIDTFAIQYVFASEEYNEYVCSPFNDVFGIFLSGPGISGPYTNGAENIAIIPGTDLSVAINSVNKGIPGTNNADSNCTEEQLNNWMYFIDNTNSGSGLVSELQYDGLTVRIPAGAAVEPGQTYHLKIAIADVGDYFFDSGIFIKEGSLGSLPEPLFINEFMASNDSTLPGPEGDYPDWIEIYNAGEDSIMLGGYYLSDDLADTSAWFQVPDTYPDSVTVAPGGFILFYANKNETASVLNLNFKLSGDGEQIGLWDPQMVILDTLTYQEQFTDTSFGRIPNGEENWVFFSNTTPHSTNTEGVIVSPLVINEFMASNDSWNIPGESEFEPFPDWIEIYNTSDTAVNMAGWYITDDLTDVVKYQLPIDDPLLTTIPAHGFLILYCDALGEGLHTNFKLSSGGEAVGISENGLHFNDRYTYCESGCGLPLPETDNSVGRLFDGSPNWVIFNFGSGFPPTSGFSNDGTVSVSDYLNAGHNKLIIYPNPVKGSEINFNKEVSIRVYSISGRLMLAKNKIFQLNISNLKSGVYLIKTDRGEIVKLIKN